MQMHTSYVRDLSISGFLYLSVILAPIPCGYVEIPRYTGEWYYSDFTCRNFLYINKYIYAYLSTYMYKYVYINIYTHRNRKYV